MNSGLYFSMGPPVSRICPLSPLRLCLVLRLRTAAALPLPILRAAAAEGFLSAAAALVDHRLRDPPQALLPRPPVVAGASSAAPSSSRDAAQRKPSRSARVLVLGGTSRVGGSTATTLSKLHPDLTILIGAGTGRKVNPLQLSLGSSLNLSKLMSAMRACWRTRFRMLSSQRRNARWWNEEDDSYVEDLLFIEGLREG